jgi:HEAT repeat protein
MEKILVSCDVRSSLDVVVPAVLHGLRDQDPTVRYQCARAIGELGAYAPEEAVDGLLKALNDPHPPVRRYAAESLGRVGRRGLTALEALERCERDPREESLVRNAARFARLSLLRYRDGDPDAEGTGDPGDQ